MQTIRHLLSQDPMTFNELLDLFEAYISITTGEIYKGHDMLREEIGAGYHVALGHVFSVAADAEDMTRRLCQIRAVRNAGTDVAITLTRIDALLLAGAIGEIDRMLSAAEGALSLLHDRAASDADNEDRRALAVMALAQRALMDTDEQEGARLRRFATRLREASQLASMC